jgi:hypothetical protein
MEELKTKLGTDIPLNIRGIFYLCDFRYGSNPTLTVVNEALFESGFDALNLYANTRNPESQLVTGKSYNDLISNLHILHKNMVNKEWLMDLAECL